MTVEVTFKIEVADDADLGFIRLRILERLDQELNFVTLPKTEVERDDERSVRA